MIGPFGYTPSGNGGTATPSCRFPSMSLRISSSSARRRPITGMTELSLSCSSRLPLLASYVAPSAPAMPTLSAASRNVSRMDFARRLNGTITPSVQLTTPSPSLAAHNRPISRFLKKISSGRQSVYAPLPWRYHTLPARLRASRVHSLKSGVA